MGLCFLSHLNRLAMSVAGTEKLIPEHGISPERMGLVYTAFLACYTAGMVLGGWCIDRLGARVMLLVMGCGSAVFGAVTGGLGLGLVGASGLLTGLIFVRGLMGLFTTPLHPACAQAVSGWIPAEKISSANGLVTFAAVLGMASAWPVFGGLMDRLGWPIAFLVTASLLMCLTWIWGVYGRDHIDFHPSPNQAERVLVRGKSLPGSARSVVPSRETSSAPVPIERRAPSPQANGLKPRPILAIDPAPESGLSAESTSLMSRSLLLLAASYAAVGYFQYLFFYWSEYYFKETLHVSTAQSRTYTTLLILALGIGMPVGGWLADRLQRRHPGQRGWATVPAIGMALSSILLFLGLLAQTSLVIFSLFTVSMFALGASESSFWQAAVQLGGRRGGLAAAIINTGGNGIGLLAPLLTPLISAQLGWHWGIAIGGIVGLLGAFCWLGIDPSRPPQKRPSPAF